VTGAVERVPSTEAAEAQAALSAALTGRSTPCQKAPELWTDGTREDAEAAAHMCRRCPVLRECRSYALAAGEKWLVWGGLDMEVARTRTDCLLRA
jgi:WhiB family transcriptional regulator, redox-sensing transcriptional regulator